MRLSAKGRCAVTALTMVSIRQQYGPVTLAEISDEQGVSLSYLEQLFARLRRDGLVAGVRGPGGGYRLAKASNAISVAAIVTAVDVSDEPRSDARSENCLTHDLWRDLSGQIHDFLDEITLADIVAREPVQAAARQIPHAS